jgi:hypothetical protein
MLYRLLYRFYQNEVKKPIQIGATLRNKSNQLELQKLFVEIT